jgi:hypothetical protein
MKLFKNKFFVQKDLQFEVYEARTQSSLKFFLNNFIFKNSGKYLFVI